MKLHKIKCTQYCYANEHFYDVYMNVNISYIIHLHYCCCFHCRSKHGCEMQLLRNATSLSCLISYNQRAASSSRRSHNFILFFKFAHKWLEVGSVRHRRITELQLQRTSIHCYFITLTNLWIFHTWFTSLNANNFILI